MKENNWQRFGGQAKGFIFFLFLFGFFIPLAQAFIWKELPEFPRAKLIKQGEISRNNQLGRISIYSVQAKRSEIIEFYKQELARSGWKPERELAPKEMNVLLFSWEDQQVTVMLQKVFGELCISVLQAQNEELLDENNCPECEEKLKALEKESGTLSPQEYQAKAEEIYKEMAAKKKDALLENDSPGEDLEFVPRYPKSVRVSSVKMDGGKKVTLAYLSRDSEDEIADFYLQSMAEEGWSLDREVDFQDMPEDFLKALKTAPPEGKSLVFKGTMGRCVIIITTNPGIDSVIIGVKYNAR